ncbi:MAG: DEAD/DEAH box helicase [Clostridia bacterium]|nr:DEAD/DEAH box helicase [Clostridia bacterium]
MQYRPHDYQAYATNFILEHPVAAVFLQMGLGKSVITLTALHELILNRFEVRRALVIAPLRVARDTWPDEIGKWDHLQGLTYSVAVGSERERRAALMQDTHIHIINRENVKWLVEKSRVPLDYDMIVIDELSSFKSHTSQRFKSMLQLRTSVRRIVGLTGTPSSNGLMDLFAEFRVLDMGKRLGRYITRYREEFFRPDKMNGMQVFTWKPLPGAEDEIYRRIGDITISMKSVDFLKMPECLSNRVTVSMDDVECAVYDQMRKQLVIDLRGREIDAKNAAALSNKLSQMANGAVYTGDREMIRFHDRKLDALEDLMEAANGQPTLIAYWFKHDLTRIQERFPEARELKTSQDIHDWNAGKIPVALIHPMSAGHGLNLQAGGSSLIWFGLTWSLELYQQTNARLWRQGQRADTVVITHIITQGTIDEQIMNALEHKDKTQAALMEAVRAQLMKPVVRGKRGGSA